MDLAAQHTFNVTQEQLIVLQDKQNGMQDQAGKLIGDLQLALGEIRQQQQQLGSILQMQKVGLTQVDHRQGVLGEDVRDIRRVQLRQNDTIDSQRRHSDTTHQEVAKDRKLLQSEVQQQQFSTIEAVGRSHFSLVENLQAELGRARNETQDLQNRINAVESIHSSNIFPDLVTGSSPGSEPPPLISDQSLLYGFPQSAAAHVPKSSTIAPPQTTNPAVGQPASVSIPMHNANPSVGSIPVPTSAHKLFPGNVTTVHAATRKPPKFAVERYGGWEDEIELWREAHQHVDESALISEIALSAEDMFRTIMLRFAKSTRGNHSQRSFKLLFETLDKEFFRDSHERSMIKMNAFQIFVRKVMNLLLRFGFGPRR